MPPGGVLGRLAFFVDSPFMSFFVTSGLFLEFEVFMLVLCAGTRGLVITV